MALHGSTRGKRMGIEVLKKELEFFQKEREILLKDHAGKLALIKDQKVVGVFDSFGEAYSKGLELFGVAPFLIKQVVAQDERMQQAPALALGLLHAHL